MLEFILARYNYWIVIILMMTGLYIVFSRGNLVKTIIGLNLFQTSVFIFYITVGKVAGGTAPILIKSAKDKAYDAHGGDHSGDHGGGHGDGYGESAHADDGHHGDVDAAEALSPEAAEAYVSGASANDLSAVPEGSDGLVRDAGLHSVPDGSANDLFGTSTAANEGAFVADRAGDAAPSVTISSGSDAAGYGADASAAHGGYAPEGAAEILYSNPLPHVLILTAIVVGVATTAVGLALAVRIREAYGTIEEDTLEAMNNRAEFGGSGEPQEATS